MKEFKISVLFSLIIAISACSDDSSSESNTQTSCENSNSYNIDNGMGCNNTPSQASIYQVETVGETRNITFNFIPPHQVLGNLTETQETFSVTTDPQLSSTITNVANTSYDGSQGGSLGYKFGIMITGVPFDPVANEPWENTSSGELNYEWNLEVLSENTELVYDCNNAHDPNRYHYHGSPLDYLASIGENGTSHSTMLGYAADGFPIYYKYGFSDAQDAQSDIVALKSSYQVKEGCRPGDGIAAPDGGYDGSYVADYEYVNGLGDLDECNGRFSVTPEYPNGIYVYYITDEFPSIPRCFSGTPSEDYKL